MFPNPNFEESKEGLDNNSLVSLKQEELHSQVRNEKTQLIFNTKRNEHAIEQPKESLGIFSFYLYIDLLQENPLTICYGVSNFQKIRLSEGLYCDKTEYIEMLEKENATSLLFLRPRRFGKSLFLDTLNCFHNELLKNDYEDLFRDLNINNVVKEGKIQPNSYMVLKLSFSDLDVSSNYDVFRMSLADIINDEISTIKALYEGFPRIENVKINIENPISSFRSLCNYAQTMNKKLYILIDEYDTALNQLIIQENPETSEFMQRLRDQKEFSL